MSTVVKRNLHCPCGEHLIAADEDELVEQAFEHLRREHPEMADRYTRSDVLFFAH
jgi:predicted small metal-binding protein